MLESGTFTVVINLEPKGEYLAFLEAFREFYHAAKATVREGTTWQLLETACFIEQRIGGKLVMAWDFMSAKERAFVLGILTEDGKLVEQVPESYGFMLKVP